MEVKLTAEDIEERVFLTGYFAHVLLTFAYIVKKSRKKEWVGTHSGNTIMLTLQ